MDLFLNILQAAWHLLLESSVYILFGLLVSGFLRVFLDPSAIARHLGRGRISSVFKAALLGIPLPLCSCGVLPAAVALKKQGANNGATAAFLISTPESGVDSVAITYALLDPIMTVARPVVAFLTAAAAGVLENIFPSAESREQNRDPVCPVDQCCDGRDCPPDEHRRHHSRAEKLRAGMRYAFVEVWNDLAGWFLIGLLLAGLITALIPDELIASYLGGGFGAMLVMLAAGIPLYICATASTPIAAALVLKGVSPGAALVFLLVGPATNIAALTVLLGVLGKRATAIYLGTIAGAALACGLILDKIYTAAGYSAQAMVGEAGELIPPWAALGGGLLLLLLSVKPVLDSLRGWRNRMRAGRTGCRHQFNQ